MPRVERRDQRLDDRRGAVVPARIAPRLEEMRLRNLPLAAFRGLVEELREVDARLHLVERGTERDVGRSGVHRVAAENQQQVHLAGFHVGDQRLQRFDLVDRLDVHRLGVGHRLANVAQRLVHRVREGMHGWRLRLARNHEARATVRLQIFADGGCPRLRLALEPAPAVPTPTAAATWRANSTISLGFSGSR